MEAIGHEPRTFSPGKTALSETGGAKSGTIGASELTDGQLDEYLTSAAWQGKAGAFGYQDRLGWVHVVKGSESNVVGLPMELLAEMIEAL